MKNIVSLKKISDVYSSCNQLVNKYFSEEMLAKTAKFLNGQNIGKEVHEIGFIIYSAAHLHNYSKDERNEIILKEFVNRVYQIPYESQYIFKWQDFNLEFGQLYLVETDNGACSFLIVDYGQNTHLIIPLNY